MLSINVLPYAVLGLLSGVSLLKILSNRKSIIITLIINILLGGTLYIILNLINIEIPFNIMTASCISVLGFPGTILLVILKMIFKIF